MIALRHYKRVTSAILQAYAFKPSFEPIACVIVLTYELMCVHYSFANESKIIFANAHHG